MILPLGGVEGCTLGERVGETLGDVLGMALGESVGETLGNKLGLTLGEFDGLSDGVSGKDKTTYNRKLRLSF